MLSIREEKILLRQKMLKQRMQKVQTEFSCPSEIIDSYKVVALYLPIQGEIDLYHIIEEIWQKGKLVVLPRVLAKSDMVFCLYNEGDQLISCTMGIKEPKTEPYIGVIDLFFVPGLVFGKDGTRLGYGAGFYDRFFVRHPQGVKIGVCYYDLLLDTIPTESHDVSMDYILTEHGLLVM